MPIRFLVQLPPTDVLSRLFLQQCRGAHADRQLIAALGRQDAGAAAGAGLAHAQPANLKIDQMRMPLAAVAASIANAEGPLIIVKRLIGGSL